MPPKIQSLVAACAILLWPILYPSFAHARLVKSNPASKAVLKESPKVIELWFNELVEENYHKIEVFAVTDRKKNLAKGKPKLDPKARTHLSIEVEPLRPGEYVIEFRVLSRDGHTSPGRIAFTVSGK